MEERPSGLDDHQELYIYITQAYYYGCGAAAGDIGELLWLWGYNVGCGFRDGLVSRTQMVKELRGALQGGI